MKERIIEQKSNLECEYLKNEVHDELLILEKINIHLYIYKGVKYENMKECREKRDLGRAEFRNLVRKGIIKKVTNAKLQRYAKQERKER